MSFLKNTVKSFKRARTKRTKRRENNATQKRLRLRTLNLAIMTEKFLPANRDGFTILCVGCRTTRELDLVEQVCGVQAKGLDVVSTDPRIEVGTMEKMTFADNSFDGLYTSYSLHHALDLKGTMQEFLRVVKPGGLIVIETPTWFSDDDTTHRKGVTKTDAKSTKHLLGFVGEAVSEICVREDFISPHNPELIARLIFRVR